MKVLLVNGSPHQKGETYKALSLVEKSLQQAHMVDSSRESLLQPLPVASVQEPTAR